MSVESYTPSEENPEIDHEQLAKLQEEVEKEQLLSQIHECFLDPSARSYILNTIREHQEYIRKNNPMPEFPMDKFLLGKDYSQLEKFLKSQYPDSTWRYWLENGPYYEDSQSFQIYSPPVLRDLVLHMDQMPLLDTCLEQMLDEVSEDKSFLHSVILQNLPNLYNIPVIAIRKLEANNINDFEFLVREVLHRIDFQQDFEVAQAVWNKIKPLKEKYIDNERSDEDVNTENYPSSQQESDSHEQLLVFFKEFKADDENLRIWNDLEMLDKSIFEFKSTVLPQELKILIMEAAKGTESSYGLPISEETKRRIRFPGPGAGKLRGIMESISEDTTFMKGLLLQSLENEQYQISTMCLLVSDDFELFEYALQRIEVGSPQYTQLFAALALTETFQNNLLQVREAFSEAGNFDTSHLDTVELEEMKDLFDILYSHFNTISTKQLLDILKNGNSLGADEISFIIARILFKRGVRDELPDRYKRLLHWLE